MWVLNFYGGVRSWQVAVAAQRAGKSPFCAKDDPSVLCFLRASQQSELRLL